MSWIIPKRLADRIFEDIATKRASQSDLMQSLEIPKAFTLRKADLMARA